MVVHAELDGDGSGFQGQDVALESAADGVFHHLLLGGVIGGKKLFFVGVRALAEPGGIAAPADVAESELPLGMAGQGVGFDISGVKSLLGDAVPEEHHAVAILDEEIAGGCAEGQGGQGQD